MRLFGWMGLLLVGWSVGMAQMPQLKFPTELVLERNAYAPGSTVKGKVFVDIPKPYHVNANPASEDYLIPTELKIEAGKHYTVGKITYPQAKEKAFNFSPNKPLRIYEGRVAVQFELTLAKNAPKGNLKVPATLRYQACDDNACYPPQRIPLEIVIKVA
ncbi:MAG: protein-disulfide reductase DsbD domain-containing protein, partial [Fimbriimonadales bacterium]